MGLHTAAELRSVLDYTTDLLTARSYDQVHSLVLAGLAEVVGSDTVTLTHLDLVDQHEVAVFWPPSRADLTELAQYPAIGRTHPLRRSVLDAASRRGHPTPLRISEVLTRRAWRKTPIYQHALRGVTDQMCLPVAFRGHQVQALTLNRTSGSFTDRQHALLAACGAHVRAALERGLLTGGVGLQLSPRLEWVSLEKAPALGPRLRGAGRGTGSTRALGTAGMARTAGTAGPAKVLSEREQEVLSLVAKGLTDSQVASRLGLRSATVSKHLHRIYRRHGLANRAAATRYWDEYRRVSGHTGGRVPSPAGQVHP